MTVLGIETSCDDCSLSVVRDGGEVLSLVTYSQIPNHRPFYGVVPEIASRLHAQSIDLVYQKTLEDARITANQIDLIAVTNRPGLIGSLTVGVSFAKGLSIALGKPLVGIDHILAHLYSPFLGEVGKRKLDYPYLAVLISGGHTLLAKQKDFDEIEVLGTTLDDACGEAFDKVAKFYNLGFPGGPIIDKISKKGDSTAYCFPVAQIKREDESISFDVSYSGLKTAVVHQSSHFLKKGKESSLENLVASFQRVAFDILLDRIKKALKVTGIKTLVLGGGVITNSYLRKTLNEMSNHYSFQYTMPDLRYCTDNGAMVAGLGYHQFLKKGGDSLNLEVYSRLDSYKRLFK